MNAGKFLVPAVHEIAVAAELAIAARAAEKSNPSALTDGPALTPEPSASMRATTSWPGTRGQSIGNRASTVPESEWQTPHTSTRILPALCAARQLRGTSGKVWALPSLHPISGVRLGGNLTISAFAR
jgi:hypothetical protein